MFGTYSPVPFPFPFRHQHISFLFIFSCFIGLWDHGILVLQRHKEVFLEHDTPPWLCGCIFGFSVSVLSVGIFTIIRLNVFLPLGFSSLTTKATTEEVTRRPITTNTTQHKLGIPGLTPKGSPGGFR
jgi:hypothetical protein